MCVSFGPFVRRRSSQIERSRTKIEASGSVFINKRIRCEEEGGNIERDRKDFVWSSPLVDRNLLCSVLAAVSPCFVCLSRSVFE